MILFKPEHVELILAGRKTQTRRLGQKRWNVGAVHQAKTRLFGVEPFARLLILQVSRERLGDISYFDAWHEGYDTTYDFLAAFERINGHYPPERQVWRVRFELAEAA